MNRLSLDAYLKTITRNPVWVLLVCALITLFFIWPLPNISFKTTVYDLVIEDLDESERYNEFLEQFGSDQIIRIVVKAKDIFDPATFAKVTKLSESAGQIDGVIRVISLPEIKKSVDRNGEWEMNKFSLMLEPVTLFQRNLISEDRKTTIITLVIEASVDKKITITAVRQLLDSMGSHLRLYQTGMPLVSEALSDYSRQDFLHLTPITLVVIAILLAVLFRNLNCLILPLSCVTLAVCWTLGLMARCDVSISMLTIIVPIFLIAVGTAYCLHICADYLYETKMAPSACIASRTTFGRLAFPVTLAVTTTLIGLASLGVNRIPAIREFALFAGFGMLSLLFIVLTFFPAMLAILPVRSNRFVQPSVIDRFFEKVLAGLVSLNLKHRKYCLIAIGSVTIFCIIGMLQLRVETNPVAFFKRSTTVSTHFHDIYQQVSGSFPVNVIMDGNEDDYFENPANVGAIAQMQRYLETLPGVDKTISLADYLRLINYVNNQFNPEFYRLPEDGYELRMLMNNFKILLGNDLLKRFLSSDYSQVNILLLTHITNSREFIRTRNQILTYARKTLDSRIDLDVTGLGVVIAASSHLLTIGQMKSLGVSLLLIFLVMVILFLSTKVGIIAVIPNLFPILVNFGIMGWLGIPLSVATTLIASIAIGLAVDDTIHYLVRYNTEFKRDLNKDRAMQDTLMSVGRPIIFTSLTISLGFSILIFSHFQPTAIFGFLMMVTMVSALIADIILLPALMMHVELVTAWDLLKMMPLMGGITPATVHELNQPLNAIKVGSDFLTMMARQPKSPNKSHLKNVAEEIGDQVARASDIIQHLSKMGQSPSFEKSPIHIAGSIEDTFSVVGNQLKLESIDLDLRIQPNLPKIMGHRNRLVQVIYNLVDNAMEAIAHQKKIDTVQKPHRITICAMEKEKSIEVTISDNGVGIAHHYQNRIFEPFFSTKDTGKGKGLGLSISHQIVRDMGGSIRATSRLGEGTKVTMTFPVLKDLP